MQRAITSTRPLDGLLRNRRPAAAQRVHGPADGRSLEELVRELCARPAAGRDRGAAAIAAAAFDDLPAACGSAPRTRSWPRQSAWCTRAGRGARDRRQDTRRDGRWNTGHLAAQAEACVTAWTSASSSTRSASCSTSATTSTAGRLDANYYDLLASEARIASLWPSPRATCRSSHWLHLGRPLTQVERLRVRSFPGAAPCSST